jgi:hypothetical protein
MGPKVANLWSLGWLDTFNLLTLMQCVCVCVCVCVCARARALDCKCTVACCMLRRWERYVHMHRFIFLSFLFFTFLPLYQACQTDNWWRVKSEFQLGIFGRHVQDVYKMLRQPTGVSSLHQNKFISHICFLGTVPTFEGLSPSDVYLWGQLKSLVYSARIEETFPTRILARQTIRNCPRILERVPKPV